MLNYILNLSQTQIFTKFYGKRNLDDPWAAKYLKNFDEGTQALQFSER